ncbi:hypothetical protein SAMN04489732_13653 [Amycolatopsis saalfeldensis]|uniref:Uncharacterized protein n=1 Tax=Amycolatopsis saalfeldensis TaxID=394193 RepID=A0A1H8YPI9_9PSEU|nr:hypothetical protein SAMN04489732_13653 [Amycolatopsis saalfeldensis]
MVKDPARLDRNLRRSASYEVARVLPQLGSTEVGEEKRYVLDNVALAKAGESVGESIRPVARASQIGGHSARSLTVTDSSGFG